MIVLDIKENLITGEFVNPAVWTASIGEKFEDGLPDTIVIHYTGGPLHETLNLLANPNVNSSAHFIIDRDGTITQMVPLDTIAWHSGNSSYKDRTGLNKYSIGIELVNSGILTKSGDIFRSVFGSAFYPEDVIEAVHKNQTTSKFWHIYTEEQIKTATELCRVLIEKKGIKHILGHDEISPSRKTDPGPAFPLELLKKQLLGESRDEDGADYLPEFGVIATNNTAITESNFTIEENTIRLRPGTKVKILEKKDGKYKISTEIEGLIDIQTIEILLNN